MIEIDEFDEEIVQELRGRARDALLTMAIAREETAEAGEHLGAVRGFARSADAADQRIAGSDVDTGVFVAQAAGRGGVVLGQYGVPWRLRKGRECSRPWGLNRRGFWLKLTTESSMSTSK